MPQSPVNLPAVITQSSDVLDKLTQSLGVPRECLASKEEIEQAWQILPSVLLRIPLEKRDAQHARMCVAVQAGLFDSAINYAWNSAVQALRQKVRDFGLAVVPQITGNDFDERTLLELKDADLLKLCLSLNLITEDSYFFLNQCRDVRNNFSSAHPPMGELDALEFLTFLDRCAKHALSGGPNPRGVDTHSFIAAIKGATFTTAQESKWVEMIGATHDAQREILVGTLHGIYCDPNSSEEARLNSLSICRRLAGEFTPKTKSDLINRHNEYIAQGKADRQAASQDFFSRLGIVALLSFSERHSMVSRVCHNLLTTHQDFNNFYNEAPFAERLLELTAQAAVPESAQPEFVEAVVVCATGNRYGVAFSARPYYHKMIRNFSPREIALMLDSPDKVPLLRNRIDSFEGCRDEFAKLVGLLSPDSIPTQSRNAYRYWLPS